MTDELNQSIESYFAKWQELISARSDKDFFETQKPTAVAWKVTDLDELLKDFTELRDKCDQIHWGWVNERWLITMHLKTEKLSHDIQIVKLMQRRPNSTDAIGLDHIDFYSPENETTEQVLGKEPELKWSKENNGHVCSWISIWFANTEAKLRADTVLDPCIAELKETKEKILANHE